MRFDKSSIAIRERSFGEILDLALWVIRKYCFAFFGLLLLGALPFAVLNIWLVPPLDVLELESNASSEYFLFLLLQHGVLMTWEAGLATAPLTLYLGQLLFWQTADRRSLFGGFFRALPQLIVYQLIFRGLFLATGLLWLFWCSSWVFLSEIILLERTPFSGKGKRGTVSTERRRRILHAHRSGDLFGRAVLGFICALLLIATISSGFLVLIWILEATDVWSQHAMFFAILPAGWIAVGYLSVVRFLSYLDQRIRNEGWELELLMWAEKARLEGESETVGTQPQPVGRP